MTPRQLQTIHVAKRQLSLTDAAYRTILRSVADVETSKDLTNQSFEDVMAILEEQGFRQGHPTYWRDKVARRTNGQANERQRRLIEALAQEISYDLPGFIARMTRGRTADVHQLDAYEANTIIEALKAIVERQRDHAHAAITAPAFDFNSHPAVTEDDPDALPF